MVIYFNGYRERLELERFYYFMWNYSTSPYERAYWVYDLGW